MDINPPVTPAKSSSSYVENIKHALGGMHVQFPKFKHAQHGPILNVNEVADERLTLGQRIADKVASNMGSWHFIIAQASIMVLWVFLNVVRWFYHFDSYPFILLNLAMSAQAAFATPLIMMSQNRQAEKDRLTAQNDYLTDCKGEEEIRHIMEHLDHQDALILQIVQHLEAQNSRLNDQEKLTLDIVQRLEAQNEFMKEQHQEMLAALSKSAPKTTRRTNARASN